LADTTHKISVELQIISNRTSAS